MKRACLIALLAITGCDKGKKEAPPAPAPAPAPTPGSATVTPPAPAPASGTPAGGAIANAVAQAQQLACQQQAKNVEGNQGTSWYMKCPACPDTNGSVWGTDLYTDDSALCLAAIHAGAITSKGGLILVTWLPGQPTYVGSARHTINTKDYGKWGRSFFVQSVDADGKPTSPAITPPPAGTIQMSCLHTASTWTEQTPVRVRCPANCTTGQSLWGTDVYSADSSVCLAAVHAGLVKADAPGEVTLTPGGAVEKLVGSARNGVTSKDYGAYDTTFTLAQ